VPHGLCERCSLGHLGCLHAFCSAVQIAWVQTCLTVPVLHWPPQLDWVSGRQSDVRDWALPSRSSDLADHQSKYLIWLGQLKDLRVQPKTMTIKVWTMEDVVASKWGKHGKLLPQ